VAVIGFSMLACDDDDDSKAPYTLEWGSWSGSYYSAVKSEVGADFHEVSSSPKSGYATGSKATEAYTFIKSHYGFDDGGTVTGEWSNLLNFSKDGIGLPSALKSAMAGQEANVPVGGVFEASNYSGPYTILFYGTKN